MWKNLFAKQLLSLPQKKKHNKNTTKTKKNKKNKKTKRTKKSPSTTHPQPTSPNFFPSFLLLSFFPMDSSPPPPSIPEMAQKMKENEKKWINLSLKKKISYLEEILSLVSLCSPSWVGLQSTTVCGIPKEREEEEGKEKREEGEGEGEEGKKGEEEEGEGEEGKGVELGEGEGVDVEKFGQICGDGYMIGPGMCAGYIHLLLETLKEMDSNNGKLKQNLHKHTNNPYTTDIIVNVLPLNFKENLIGMGLVGQLFLEGEGEGKEKGEGEGEGEREGEGGKRGGEYEGEGSGVVFVLGAGNFSAPIEVLTKMFLEKKVVIYKPNPVNQTVTLPIYKYIFAPLIKDGFISIFEGGIQESGIMIRDPNVKEVMITGSDKTYDAIVWGSPRDQEEQQRRKREGEKEVEKQVDAELGNINVASIIPGKYTKKEMKKMTDHLAHVRVLNGGHCCPSPQILLVDKQWKQKEEFKKEMKRALSSHLPIPCYYPGTKQKYDKFANNFSFTPCPYSGTAPLPEGYLEPLLAENIGENPDLFMNFESFCPIMGIYEIEKEGEGGEGERVEWFCKEIVEMVNEKTWGNLATTLFASSPTLSSHRPTITEAVAKLEVGSVGINIWGGTCVFFPQFRWGGYPGNTPEDIQSGSGRGVGNFLCYDGVKKSVLWAPLLHDFVTVSPSSPAQARKEGMRLSEFNTTQSYFSLIKVASALYFGI